MIILGMGAGTDSGSSSFSFYPIYSTAPDSKLEYCKKANQNNQVHKTNLYINVQPQGDPKTLKGFWL